MAAIGTLPVLFATGDHASRPAASAVGSGGLYSCTTHSLVYQTDGSSWSTWATLSAGLDLDAAIAASAGQDIADALAGAAAPDAGNVFATMADVGGGGGALVLLEQHTASGSATLDFTTFISSTYDQYLFQLINIVPATDDTQLRVRVGTGAGPTYDTGTNYAWALRIDRSGGTATNGADSGQAFIGLVYQAGGTLGIDSANTMGWCGNLYLFDPQNAAAHKRFMGDGTYFDNEPFSMRTTVQGAYLSTTAVTAVRFYMDTGNIASGTIRVYGIVK